MKYISLIIKNKTKRNNFLQSVTDKHFFPFAGTMETGKNALQRKFLSKTGLDHFAILEEMSFY